MGATYSVADARVSLDLIALFEMLERWRRVALLQQDPARFHAVARRAAELLTGQPCPDDEPLVVTRAKAGICPASLPVYTLRSSDQVDDQIAHLPRQALAAFAEVRRPRSRAVVRRLDQRRRPERHQPHEPH